MGTKVKKTAVVTLPLTAFKCLYKKSRGRKIVCEIDVPALKRVNEPTTIDEIVAEARLEQALGKTKTFSSAQELMKELRA